MDKHSLAEWAKNLLEDDYFKSVINELKSSQISAILATDLNGIDEREDAYRTIKTIDLIVGHLSSLAAEKQIRDKRFKIL